MQSNVFDKCVHRYNTEILKLFEPELQMNNTKSVQNKLKNNCEVS